MHVEMPTQNEKDRGHQADKSTEPTSAEFPLESHERAEPLTRLDRYRNRILRFHNLLGQDKRITPPINQSLVELTVRRITAEFEHRRSDNMKAIQS